MLLIRRTDRHGARIDDHTRTRAVVTFNGESRSNILDAYRTRFYGERIGRIVHHTEVGDAVQYYQTLLVISGFRHHQSAGRTEQHRGTVPQHELPALANGCRERPTVGVEFGAPQTLPNQGPANYDHARRGDFQ